MKPNQINDYSKSSYANSELQQLSFYVDTELFVIKQYEEEINYKMLTDEEQDDGFITNITKKFFPNGFKDTNGISEKWCQWLNYQTE